MNQTMDIMFGVYQHFHFRSSELQLPKFTGCIANSSIESTVHIITRFDRVSYGHA